jgi:hypothetical protein
MAMATGALGSARFARNRARRHAWRALIAPLVVLLVAAASVGVAHAQAAPSPVRCRVGAYVIALYDFDYAANTFRADFWLWSVCPTAELTPLDTLEFVNASSVTTRLQTFEPAAGAYWAQRKITGTFREDWDLRQFPFDRHTLTIALEAGEQDANQLRFTPDLAETNYDHDMMLPGWRIVDFRLNERLTDYQTTFGDPALPEGRGSHYSRLDLAIDLVRTQLSTFFQLTAVVYAAFVLTLIAYFFHLEGTGALAIQVGLLGGALFATAINLASAGAALGRQNGLTLIDEIHLAVVLYILIAAVIAVGSRFLLEHGWTQGAIARLNRWAFVVAAVSFLALNAVLILHAARMG